MKKGMVISVDGGLGDHVSAEPAVRYLIEKVYPDWDIHISCGVPRVFEHLSAKVYLHNQYDAERELGYEKRFTFPTTGALRDALCFLTAHMVDYHAAALLYRALPLNDKRVKLIVKPEDEQELVHVLGGVDPRTLILVHAGRSWKSKTFPAAWWQSTVDTLSQAGFQVALVGKREGGGETGLVEIDLPRGGVDLRDRLSLGGLFALMSRARALVSNDSSLIQIAGAFDIGIVLIATCKHPDFVLPYRNNTPYYKAVALYKRLLIDTLPFEPLRDGSLSVDVPVDDWSRYLPSPEEVSRSVSVFP